MNEHQGVQIDSVSWKLLIINSLHKLTYQQHQEEKGVSEVMDGFASFFM